METAVALRLGDYVRIRLESPDIHIFRNLHGRIGRISEIEYYRDRKTPRRITLAGLEHLKFSTEAVVLLPWSRVCIRRIRIV